MENTLMNLKVLLPFSVFAEVKNVSRIVAETGTGSYGFLPQRLDCIAALVPGIFIYETENGREHYLAIDEGVLVKAGIQVMVSVRNAIAGDDLGKLHESVEKDFKVVDETERNVRLVAAKLESGLIYSLNKFRK